MGHAHVGHGQHGARTSHRHVAGHSLPRRQGATREAATVHGLGKDGVCNVLGGLDYDVVRLRDGDADFVRLHRLHVLPTHLNHRHGQSRDPNVEVRGGARVDEAQPNPLARTEEAGPVRLRGHPVHQIRVCRPRDVGDVRGVHAHVAPPEPIAQRREEALVPRVPEEVRDGPLLVVVVVGPLLQAGQDPMRILEGPVPEHHHVVPVVLEGFLLGGIDDERAILAQLLLESRVAVVPVGPVLADRVAVLERFAGGDAVEGDHGNAVHTVRKQDSVPVDGGVLLQRVGDPDHRLIAFPESQEGPRKRAVDGRRRPHPVSDANRGLRDGQIDGTQASVEDLRRGVPKVAQAQPRVPGHQRVEAGQQPGGSAKAQEGPSVQRFTRPRPGRETGGSRLHLFLRVRPRGAPGAWPRERGTPIREA